MPFDERSEVLPLNQLHRKIMPTLLELAEVEYTNDIGVGELSSDDDLSLKSGYKRGVGEEAGIEELQRDYLVVEAGVVNLVHRAHTASADLADRSIPTGGRLREVFGV